jgi:hypothetical protein
MSIDVINKALRAFGSTCSQSRQIEGALRPNQILVGGDRLAHRASAFSID